VAIIAACNARRLRAALDLDRRKSELHGGEKWKHFSGLQDGGLRRIELRRGGGLGGDDDAGGRLGPLPGCADAAVGAQRADDAVSGNVNVFHLFEDVLENELHVSSPKLVEARGARVAIDGRTVAQRVAGGKSGYSLLGVHKAIHAASASHPECILTPIATIFHACKFLSSFEKVAGTLVRCSDSCN